MEINKNYQQELIKLRRADYQDVGLDISRLYRWWRAQDRRYRWLWRAGNGVAAVLILASVALPVVSQLYRQSEYRLSAAALSLVGNTDQTLAKQLTYDPAKQLYQFNKDAVKSSYDPTAALQSQVGTASGKDKSLYALDVPQDLSQGVTYHDTNSQLSFGLKPEFKSSQGQMEQGHLVYPLSGGTQAIYTLKNNGLKEDIVVPKASEATMRFNYQLDLPKTLAAKVIPNSEGAIGIYSADPSLFGNISYGSDADQATVEKARENGDKTYLVFGLPAPVIKAPNGASVGNASARFELSGNQLTVVAENLSEFKTPITIDPSVVVTSATDFQTNGNNESNINFDTTNNQITRGGLTGGGISAGWTITNYIPTARANFPTVAYNGYLYILGGGGATYYNDVQYASINAVTGQVGSWAPTSSFANARFGNTAAVYNGYMYLMGGYDGTTYYNDVQYAKINSDGTVGSWAPTTSFTAGRYQHASAVYNDYLYVTGGYDGSTFRNDVQYARINADGTIGTWASTTGFTNGRKAFAAVTYNGYLYIMGGASGTFYNDVQYAQINADGTVSSWTSTTPFTNSRLGLTAVVYDGYVYIMGGLASDGTTLYGDVQYAPIYANGGVGPWTPTSSLITGNRYGQATAVYNGYIYVMGGYNGTSNLTNTDFAPIDPAGYTQAWSKDTTHNLSAARSLMCSVAYNGYLYSVGGSPTDDYNSPVSTVQYTALGSDGSLGNWQTSTHSLPSADGGRSTAGCAASNGFIYLVGGVSRPGGVTTFDGKVYHAPIGGSGDLTADWTLDTSRTTSANPSYTSWDTSVFIYNGFIYSMGEIQGDQVIYAPINSDGSVGTWAIGSGEVENTYHYRAYARVGGYLYALGGANAAGSTKFNKTEYAPINSNGSIGTWTESGMGTLPNVVGYANATTVNGCMYVYGGDNSSGTIQNKVAYGCPAANGAVANWSSAPLMVTATEDMGAASYNGYIYGVGGKDTAVRASTQSVAVNNGGNGNVTNWSAGSNGLATGVYATASTAYNGYIYVVGGDTGTAARNTVQYSKISSKGDLGAFATGSHSFSTARTDAATVAYNGYLYVWGGGDHGGTTLYGDVQYALICTGSNSGVGGCGSTAGDVGTWASAGGSFTTGVGSDTHRANSCAVAYNGYVYAMGGWDGTNDHNDVRYAATNANGTLGSWADSGHTFTTARSDSGCFTANGYLYILGGDGTTLYNDVQSAPINSNGTLGAFTATTSFNGPRADGGIGYSNGFAYVFNGCTTDACTAGYDDTQRAPVNANGTLGDWQTTSDAPVWQHYNETGFAYNGYLYELGGNGGFGRDDTAYAPIAAIPRIATYSKLLDLGVPTNVTGITYSTTGLPLKNAMSPGASPISFRTAGSNGVFGNSTNVSAIIPGATLCLASSANYTRYILVTVTLDDSSGGSGIFPDIAGTPTNITDFTVNYNTVHPTPNIRLRAGQTLQTGNLSALDTCTP